MNRTISQWTQNSTKNSCLCKEEEGEEEEEKEEEKKNQIQWKQYNWEKRHTVARGSLYHMNKIILNQSNQINQIFTYVH